VFSEGRVLELNVPRACRGGDFRTLAGHGFKGFSKMKLRTQDKGHGEEVRRFLEAVEKGAASSIPYEDLRNVTLATFAAVESAASGQAVKI
jgi:hypothetical protein